MSRVLIFVLMCLPHLSFAFGSYEARVLGDCLLELPVSLQGVPLSELDKNWVDITSNQEAIGKSIGSELVEMERCTKVEQLVSDRPELVRPLVGFPGEYSELSPFVRCHREVEKSSSIYIDQSSYANSHMKVIDFNSQSSAIGVRVIGNFNKVREVYAVTPHTFTVSGSQFGNVASTTFSEELNWIADPAKMRQLEQGYPEFFTRLNSLVQTPKTYAILTSDPQLQDTQAPPGLDLGVKIEAGYFDEMIGTFRPEDHDKYGFVMINRRKGDIIGTIVGTKTGARPQDPKKLYDVIFEIPRIAFVKEMHKLAAWRLNDLERREFPNFERTTWDDEMSPQSQGFLENFPIRLDLKNSHLEIVGDEI